MIIFSVVFESVSTWSSLSPSSSVAMDFNLTNYFSSFINLFSVVILNFTFAANF